MYGKSSWIGPTHLQTEMPRESSHSIVSVVMCSLSSAAGQTNLGFLQFSFCSGIGLAFWFPFARVKPLFWGSKGWTISAWGIIYSTSTSRTFSASSNLF